MIPSLNFGYQESFFQVSIFLNVYCWKMSSWHFYYLTQLPFIGNFQSCGKFRSDSEWIIIEAIVRCWLCWTCWKPLVCRDPFKVPKQKNIELSNDERISLKKNVNTAKKKNLYIFPKTCTHISCSMGHNSKIILKESSWREWQLKFTFSHFKVIHR